MPGSAGSSSPRPGIPVLEVRKGPIRSELHMARSHCRHVSCWQDTRRDAPRRRVPDIYDTNATVLEFRERRPQTGGNSGRSHRHRGQRDRQDTLPWKGSARKRSLGISYTSASHFGLREFRRRVALHNVRFDSRRVKCQPGTLLVMNFQRKRIPGICGTISIRFENSIPASTIFRH